MRTAQPTRRHQYYVPRPLSRRKQQAGWTLVRVCIVLAFILALVAMAATPVVQLLKSNTTTEEEHGLNKARHILEERLQNQREHPDKTDTPNKLAGN